MPEDNAGIAGTESTGGQDRVILLDAEGSVRSLSGRRSDGPDEGNNNISNTASRKAR